MPFTMKHRKLSDLDIRDIEFELKTGWLVIVNWGTMLKGKPVLLLTGSPEYQGALEDGLLYRL